MFGLGKGIVPQPLCCLLRNNGYSLIGLTDNQHILFCEDHFFPEPSSVVIAKCLAEDVIKHRLVGRSCQVILAPGLYQMLLMDIPEVPVSELSKALRWQLKGLIDYPLNDIIVDAFVVPPHGARGKRKKVFTTVTLRSALINKMSMMESCLLNVTGISISELALGKILSLDPILTETLSIVISYDDEVCQHLVYYHGDLYLSRTLPMSNTILKPNSSAKQTLSLEIQRSIDYCLMELNLPEPKQILFTPCFYEATDLFTFLKAELNKEVKLLDIQSFFSSEPMTPEVMANSFYAFGGALMSSTEKSES